MQYLGGKANWGRSIVELIEPWRTPGDLFVDVCCGALNVVRHAAPPRVAIDANEALITTLQACLDGWDPPIITEQQYRWFSRFPNPADPRTALALFGCSWGGKWRGGYARDQRREPLDFAKRSRMNLLEKARDCPDLVLACLDYRALPVPPPGTILYCDPPYEGTTGYGALPAFNNAEFWTWAARMQWLGSKVFVSEGIGAKPPAEWTIYFEFATPSKLDPNRAGRKRIERLYVHRSSAMAAYATRHRQLSMQT